MPFLQDLHAAYAARGPRRLIGLISGTSADAIDAALIEVTGDGDAISARCIAAIEQPNGARRARILEAAEGKAGAEALCRLHAEMGEAFAAAAVAVADAAGIPLSTIHAIGCHGQTIWHAPPEPGSPDEHSDEHSIGYSLRMGSVGSSLQINAVGSSLQIGNASVIAARTGCVVVSDFRSADLALGGQGAPLVPLADWLLLRHPGRRRAIQNLGGIANVTYLPAAGAASDVRAFDTGPGNMLIDALARRASGGARDYDDGGALASRGAVSRALLDRLMREPYLSRRPPKSTGRELFGEEYAGRLWTDGQALGLTDADIVATATAFTAAALARAYREFLPPIDEVILGGGGARNPVLRREIEERIAPVPVRTHEEIGWNSDSKEAVAFALLADRTLLGLPGSLPQVTGATRPAVLGTITPPP